MFGLFKKKEAQKEVSELKGKLFSPANGEVIAIDKVSDPVFSQKMMGDGYAVIPTDGKIYSPVNGKVLSVFPTKHAVGILMDNGVEILLHMGLDTVELNGAPFDTVVTEGQLITPETLISTVDLDQLKAAGKDNAMVVVITNMEKVADYHLTVTGEAKASTEVASYTVA